MGSESLEKTLALIKPDAVAGGHVSEIKQLIELAGFVIVAEQELQLTSSTAETFYAEHAGKPFFNGLVQFMTGGPILAMVLAKPNAIRAWRELMGPTNVLEARIKAPKSLRALYGSDGTRNAVHGSDSPVSAMREISFFFPQLIHEPLPDPITAQQFFEREVQPTLVKALTALAKEKSAANMKDGVLFLANWLLNNNPNRPKVICPDEVVVPVAQDLKARSPKGDVERRRPQVEVVTVPVIDRSALESEAATKVQAAYRGHLVRKRRGGP